MSEELQKRFRDYEISPPPSVWLGIAKHLGEQDDNLLIRDMVLETEIEPPAETWTLIAESIGKNRSVNNRTGLFRIKQVSQAAAVIAGIMVVGSFFLFNNKVRKNSIALVPSTGMLKIDPASLSISGAIKKPLLAKIASGFPKASSIYTNFRSKKKTPLEIPRQLEKAVVNDVEEQSIPEPSIAAKPIRNEKGEIIQDLKVIKKPNQNYVSVTSPDGSPTKISAKFAHFLLYLNGDNDTDSKEGVFHKSFLESLTWKTRFQNWRTALSQNTFVPTSTNFMDILELKDFIMQQKDID